MYGVPAKKYGYYRERPKPETPVEPQGNRNGMGGGASKAWGGEIPSQPATYYRRKAARARQVAEGMTAWATKARLLDEAVHCDQLAADADRGRKKPQICRRDTK
jgi:hypothetical protein